MSESNPRIGLSLSGGGSRAIAFHLGCMRALHDLGVLNKVDVLSTVSGGSVIGAMYAYSDCSFEEFEKRIELLLASGLSKGIGKYTFLSLETPKILVAIATSGFFALLGRVVSLVISLLGIAGFKSPLLRKFSGVVQTPLVRFASRTTAFAKFLDRTYFNQCVVSEVMRENLQVVINATELKTQTAFRYGSFETGCWRHGVLDKPPTVAKAVAASAAFPGFLPALDEKHIFEKDGKTAAHRVLITDGGVYDNLGTSCLVPGRDRGHSLNVHEVDIIIACVAGQGLSDGEKNPYFMPSRMFSTVNTIHQRTHSLSFDQLHRLAENKEIDGFVMPYLGQQDKNLPSRPDGFVGRSEVYDYPTNFSSMSQENIEKLSRRGEQLTKILMGAYQPSL